MLKEKLDSHMQRDENGSIHHTQKLTQNELKNLNLSPEIKKD